MAAQPSFGGERRRRARARGGGGGVGHGARARHRALLSLMQGREAAPTVSDADETGAYVAAAKKEAAAAATAAKRRSAPPPRTTTRRQSVEVQARLLGEGGGKNHAKARLQQQHEARAAERAEKLRVALAKPCDEMAVVGIIGRATAESLASMQSAFIADGGPPLAKALSIGLSDSRKELKAMLESLVRALTHEAHTAEFESSGGDDDGDDDLEDNPAYADELATRVGEGHVLLRREIRALKRVAGTAVGAAAGEARRARAGGGTRRRRCGGGPGRLCGGGDGGARRFICRRDGGSQGGIPRGGGRAPRGVRGVAAQR